MSGAGGTQAAVRRRLGVLGWPVAHSRSPAMHNAAFAALRMDGWRYQLLPAPPALFAEMARALGPAGFLGANVTIPHKHAALALADTVSEACLEIGAANTLTFTEEGAIVAENTDAPGLIAALALNPAGRSAVVLGAGGSARAAVWALLRAGADVSVWNRTRSRAVALAEDLGARALRNPESAEILVNCTSVGLSGGATLNQLGLTADLLSRCLYVIDFVYSDDETALLCAAREAGAGTLAGIEVLVRQGALSFEAWTGRAAPLEVMRQAALRGVEPVLRGCEQSD